MRQLFVESILPVSPERAWDIFESDAFRDRLATQTGLRSELLESRQDGDVEVRILRFTSGTPLPAMMAKVLGSPSLSYRQTNRFDRGASRLDWQVEIPGLEKRVRVGGRTTITPHPDGCRRVVDGTIEVKLPLVGARIENHVADVFRRSMEQAVDLARSMLDGDAV